MNTTIVNFNLTPWTHLLKFVGHFLELILLNRSTLISPSIRLTIVSRLDRLFRNSKNSMTIPNSTRINRKILTKRSSCNLEDYQGLEESQQKELLPLLCIWWVLGALLQQQQLSCSETSVFQLVYGFASLKGYCNAERSQFASMSFSPLYQRGIVNPDANWASNGSKRGKWNWHNCFSFWRWEMLLLLIIDYWVMERNKSNA